MAGSAAPCRRKGSVVQKSFMDVIRLMIETAWRRRYQLVVPVLIMLPCSILLAMVGPKTYIAKSLLQLQETGTSNPLGKEFTASNTKMQERMAGLQALMKSDRVLGNVYRDLFGETTAADSHQIAVWVRDFSPDLSLDLIGTDFIEIKLKGGNPRGMGKRLESVTARFIEALLPEQNAQFATQVLLDKRRDDLDTAERALAEFRKRNAEVLPLPGDGPQHRLAAARIRIDQLTASIEDIKNDIGAVQARLARSAQASTSATGRIDQQIAQVSAQLRDLQGRGNDAGAELEAIQGRLADLTKVRGLEAQRVAAESELGQLRKTSEALQRHARQAAPVMQQLAVLEREAQEARETFDAYSRRYARSNAGRAGGILNAPERIKLIDVPRDPEIASASGRQLAIGAMAASILLGVGLALLAELFDSRIRRPEDLEMASGLPTVGRLS